MYAKGPSQDEERFEDGRTVYLVVKYKDTYAFSFESFPDPDWLGNG